MYTCTCIIYNACVYTYIGNIEILLFFLIGDDESVKGFLKHFEDSFMEDACAKETARKLRRKGVIPEDVETDIERAKDREGANEELYDHLSVQGTFECLKTVCDVFIRKEGYARTNQLGERMKNELIRRHKY